MRAIEIWSGFGSILQEDAPLRKSRERPVMVLPEYAYVILTKSYRDADLPVGAKGTVLSVFPKTQTYTIEFFEPRRCVETVPMNIVAELNAKAS
jgi:hypothetical protein